MNNLCLVLTLFCTGWDRRRIKLSFLPRPRSRASGLRGRPTSPQRIQKLRAESNDEAFDALVGDSWNGGIVSYVSVEISQNNQTPVSSSSLIRGPIFENKEKAFKTAKFFDLEAPGYLVFANLDCSLFNFHNGLTLNYLDLSEIPFEYRLQKDSDPLPINGVAGFLFKSVGLPYRS